MKMTNNPPTIEAPNLVFDPLDYIDFRINPADYPEERMAINTFGRLAMVKEREFIDRWYAWPNFSQDQLGLVSVSLTQNQISRNSLYVVRDVDGLWGLGKVNPNSMVATFTWHQKRERVFDTYQREAMHVFLLSTAGPTPSWSLPDRTNQYRKTAAHWIQRSLLLPLQLGRAAWANGENDNDALVEMIDDESSLMYGLKFNAVRQVFFAPLAGSSPDTEEVRTAAQDIDEIGQLVLNRPNHRLERIYPEALAFVSKGN